MLFPWCLSDIWPPVGEVSRQRATSALKANACLQRRGRVGETHLKPLNSLLRTPSHQQEKPGGRVCSSNLLRSLRGGDVLDTRTGPHPPLFWSGLYGPRASLSLLAPLVPWRAILCIRSSSRKTRNGYLALAWSFALSQLTMMAGPQSCHATAGGSAALPEGTE